MGTVTMRAVKISAEPMKPTLALLNAVLPAPLAAQLQRRQSKRKTSGMRKMLSMLGCVALALAQSLDVSAADDTREATDRLVVRPAADDSMLLNPGKGWVQYYGTDKYTKDFIGIGYTRCCWSDVEPKENEFDWRPVDDFIKRFKADGKKIAHGVMSISTGIGKEYVTPKWVFDAGAEALSIPDASSPTKHQFIVKYWDDPVFVKKLGEFVAAFGKRYDGNPDIAFIDIRDYGNWGEGHVGFLGVDLAPPEIYKNFYLQPYIAAFPHKQLIVPWGYGGYDTVYDWAITKGAGIRRDGILSKYSKDGSECLRAYGHAPAVFEYCDGYEETKKNGYWSTDLLMKYIEAGKPSYMQWNNKIFEENRDFCLKLGNKIGYHFVLQQAVVPREIQAAVPFQIEMQWLNDGVAYLYEPCSVAVALLDRQNRVIQKQWLTGSHPNRWKPDEPAAETHMIVFPSVPAGTCKLAIGLFLDQQDADPVYRLGIQGRTDHGWYVLSEKLECKP